MPTFPASKVFQCQFCPKCFLTDGARKTHNVFEYRDYALAYIRMDEVGGATGEAGGARDEVGGAMNEAQEASPPKKACTSSVRGTEGPHRVPA